VEEKLTTMALIQSPPSPWTAIPTFRIPERLPFTSPGPISILALSRKHLGQTLFAVQIITVEIMALIKLQLIA
jgi:hypothetical protein